MAGRAEEFGEFGGEVVRAGTSCRVAQRQLALAHGVGGVAQRLGHVLRGEVGQLVGDLGYR
jgi:hypothetical protein